MSSNPLRALPAVHQLAGRADLAELAQHRGQGAVMQAARTVLDSARQAVRQGASPPPVEELARAVRAALEEPPTVFTPVVNATGVVLHTNLGRAPIAEPARRAMLEAMAYCDVELDLDGGKRASRLRHVSAPLAELTGAEAGLVVNNCAGALLLSLAALAGRRPTAISRGHLVEIGGGFRLPTIMEASGSPLVELGTTNRTHLDDYAQALESGVGLVLVVHRSNFVMQGYVAEPPLGEIVALAHAHDTPVIFDLGSGALFDTTAHGAPDEITVAEAVAQGFDVVCFSGDKLVGGPQAGYAVGTAAAIERLRRHPLARALRCDKVQLAGCLATLELYRRAEAGRQIPIWHAIGTPASELRARAEAWQTALGRGEVIGCNDAVGGGSLPEAHLEGFALALAAGDPDALLRALRRGDPPVVGHIEGDRVLLHPRTVDSEQDTALIEVVRRSLEALP